MVGEGELLVRLFSDSGEGDLVPTGLDVWCLSCGEKMDLLGVKAGVEVLRVGEDRIDAAKVRFIFGCRGCWRLDVFRQGWACEVNALSDWYCEKRIAALPRKAGLE